MKLVAFGELMLRLSPPDGRRLVQTTSFDACFGGAEANVATLYALLGGEATYVTALPDNPLGHAAQNALRAQGVDCRHTVFSGPRIGVYYLEKGSSLRSSQVVYDRAGSSFSLAEPSAYDWDTLLSGADWFFFTGITAALGGRVRKALSDALAACRRLGVCVACDLNYRAKLWSVEEAAAVIRPLVRGLDLLIANEEHAARVLGISSRVAPEFLGGGWERELVGRRENAVRMAAALRSEYAISAVAMTLRTTLSAEETVTGAYYTDGTAAAHSADHKLRALDRVGSGDAYAGGLLYGLSEGMTAEEANRFSAAASALAHTVAGDLPCLTREEILHLANGGGSRIQR